MNVEWDTLNIDELRHESYCYFFLFYLLVIKAKKLKSELEWLLIRNIIFIIITIIIIILNVMMRVTLSQFTNTADFNF